jgi:uncharacterized protein with von Willebrand factor type A (vWA) domain
VTEPGRPDIARVVVGFARTLRAAGVTADPIRTQTAIAALSRVGAGSRTQAKAALRAALVSDPSESAAFDAAFAVYFSTALPESAAPSQPGPLPRPTLLAVPDALPGDTEETSGADAVGSASANEVLRRRDLAALTDSERAAVAQMIGALRLGGPRRPARRSRPARHGAVDGPATARATLARAGEPQLRRARPVDRPRRMVLLLDVSGSMAAYADSYLRFAHVAARRRRGTEVFTLGTRLTRITRQLGAPSVDDALRAAADAVPDWSGGTRLGDQLRAFLDRWGQRGSARGAVAVLFSDGWERGDTALLAEQMERLHRLAHRVVWVNPHSGKAGFSPSTAGMRAAMPSIDVLHEGHTLEALTRLGALLSDSRLNASASSADPSRPPTAREAVDA